MKTKIICTLGPSTDSDEIIQKLLNNGMNIARFNFSHNDHEYHGNIIDKVRFWAEKLDKKVEILCDLQGPKIRLGHFDNPPKKLNTDEIIDLETDVTEKPTPGNLIINDKYVHTDVKPGDAILINDGKVSLEVVKVVGSEIVCKVINGGEVRPLQGVNFPHTVTTTSTITDKDKKDLSFILTKNPDWIAISFVQSPRDINDVKDLIGDSKSKIMCKIEKAQAIENLEEIIKNSDGIMVARGDLGVEIPIERLPITQKEIIKKCNEMKTFVVTATQMLDSMTKSPFPTRAEATDISNAIFDGTDALMLSNETAIGKYPITALKIMAKIAKETEKYLEKQQ